MCTSLKIAAVGFTSSGRLRHSGALQASVTIMSKADEDAIRETELQFNEAWGRHDAEGMVATMTDDLQFVTVNGSWSKNREEYRDLMLRLHGPQGPFRASTRETPHMIVRFL